MAAHQGVRVRGRARPKPPIAGRARAHGAASRACPSRTFWAKSMVACRPCTLRTDENDHADLRTRATADDAGLAKRIGGRLKESRLRAGLTQQQLAGERYTKAYVSALENGLVRPSMAALTFFAERLRVPASGLIGDEAPTWSRLEADLHLAVRSLGRRARRVHLADRRCTTEPARRAEVLERSRGSRGPPEPRRGSGHGRCRGGRACSSPQDRGVDAALATYWLANGQFEQDNLAEARALLRSILDRVRAGLRVAPDFEFRVLMALSSVEAARRPARARIRVSPGGQGRRRRPRRPPPRDLLPRSRPQLPRDRRHRGGNPGRPREPRAVPGERRRDGDRGDREQPRARVPRGRQPAARGRVHGRGAPALRAHGRPPLACPRRGHRRRWSRCARVEPRQRSR